MSNENAQNNNDLNDGCAGCIGCLFMVIFVIPIVCTIIYVIGVGCFCGVVPEHKFCQEMEQQATEQKAIEEQQRLKEEELEREKALRPETTNGIQFSIISKEVTNEATLRGMGIPSSGNSLVLVVTVNVKNAGKEPYKPHIKARLLDENGAIYAGNVYTNVFEILNSAQNILNPGMEKQEILFFKIPENKNFTIEFQDGTFFSDTVSIKL